LARKSELNIDLLIERLRAPGAPLEELADLLVDDLLQTPLEHWLDAGALASALHGLLVAWNDSDRAEARLLEELEALLEHLAAGEGLLGERLAPELRRMVETLGDSDYRPERETFLALLDREPFRRLLRSLLTDELVAFGKKVSVPVADNRLAKGLGGLARFAKEQATARAGPLGSIATGMVGAVSEELERQLERRAAEFADTALSGILQRLASLLTDPAWTADQRELRLEIVAGAFELEGATVARELARAEPAAIVKVVRQGVGAWLRTEASHDVLLRLIRRWVRGQEGQTVGDVLASVALLEVAKAAGRKAALQRIEGLVSSEAFVGWLHLLGRPR
jgi:hypothetical protein